MSSHLIARRLLFDARLSYILGNGQFCGFSFVADSTGRVGETRVFEDAMSVLDQPNRKQRRARTSATGDRLGWVAGVMIVIGAALCFAALLNI